MSRVSYANMKLKINTSTKELELSDGNKIEVLQYLPIEDKNAIIMATLQKSKEDNGIYSPLKLDMYFHLHLIYMYTNISFTEKQKEDEIKLYDTLASNEILNRVVALIPEEEYQSLFEFMEQYINAEMEYTTSVSGIIGRFIHELPEQAQAAQQIVDNFKPEQFQAVLDFARAANGNRDI